MRKATIVMASAAGTPVVSIARLLAAHEDTTLSTATTRLGKPFTRWSVSKFAVHPTRNPVRRVRIGRERLRQILRERGITFQRTQTWTWTWTWKESTDPDFDTKLDRIEHVTTRFPQRCFAFDQFGPLSIRPHHGSGWASRSRPDRLPATYTRTHGIRYFHG